MATYLFIDGAYLRSRLKYISKNFVAIDPLDINYEAFRSAIAQKAFYYDCLSARGPSEKGDDYDKRVEPQQNHFKAIKSLPGYHVILGEAVHSGGDIVQKGVDIRIAVDMLTYSFRLFREDTNRLRLWRKHSGSAAPLAEAGVQPPLDRSRSAFPRRQLGLGGRA
jgi:hypothetical protein